MTLPEMIERRKFVWTAELNPPKGVDCGGVLRSAEEMAFLVDAVNVTDGAGAVMRMGSLPVCHLLRDRGIEPVFQLTCRDRNRVAIQSDLLSACALGVRNVLCLTGDHVLLGDHPDARPSFDLDSVSLLWTVTKLNGGRDMRGNVLKGASDLCSGAAVNPNASPAEPQVFKMRRKAEAGARFFQTQAVFEISGLTPFLALASDLKIPLIMGILVLSSPKGVRLIQDRVPGIRVPAEVVAAMERSKNPVETGLEIAIGLAKEAKKICQGVHFMNASPGAVRRIIQETGGRCQ